MSILMIMISGGVPRRLPDGEAGGRGAPREGPPTGRHRAPAADPYPVRLWIMISAEYPGIWIIILLDPAEEDWPQAPSAKEESGKKLPESAGRRLAVRHPMKLWLVSNIHVLRFLPDPGALSSCMHRIPQTNVGLLWICYVFGHGIWDPPFETSRIEIVRTDRTARTGRADPRVRPFSYFFPSVWAAP